MAGLQRSAQTFRRSGSSGLVWDERFLTEGGGGAPGLGRRRQPELRHSRSVGSVGMLRRDEKKRTKLLQVVARPKQHKDQMKQEAEEAVVVPSRKAFRTRDVAPAAQPPSPRVPAGCCAPCALFRGSGAAASASLFARRAKPRKRHESHQFAMPHQL